MKKDRIEEEIHIRFEEFLDEKERLVFDAYNTKHLLALKEAGELAQKFLEMRNKEDAFESIYGSLPNSRVKELAKELCKNGKPLQATKLLNKGMGLTLKDAKEYIKKNFSS